MKKHSVKEFKQFVYEPGEGHFFYLCAIHQNLMTRKQDVAEDLNQPKKDRPACDWPTCPYKANYVFFPNLVTVLKRQNSI